MTLLTVKRRAACRPAIHRAGVAGFSLLEVSCAVLILGVALVGITQGITTALQSHKDSELLTKSAVFAAGLIETLRAEGDPVNGSDGGDCGQGLDQCSWKQTIRNSDVDGLHEVEVIIQDSAGKPIYALQTMLFAVPALSSQERNSSSRNSTTSNRGRTP
jgi:prepilin-type N-terminal cleavage/methylation domain-containing protein